MNSTRKGDELEDAFYEYLLEQQDRGEDIYGLYPHGKCKIFRKKKYPSKDRGAPVQFDVVIEFFQTGRTKPHLYVVFECKHYKGNISDDRVREFSDKLKEIFPNRHKGVMVVSSKLQSGARNVAESRGLGIAKFDQHGLEIVADRKGRSYAESGFVKSQLFQSEDLTKSLKFSAYCDGRFFGTVAELLEGIETGLSHATEAGKPRAGTTIPYISAEDIKKSAHSVLKEIDYKRGIVDLAKVCSLRGIDLIFVDSVAEDIDGCPILGTANFERNSIQINHHNDSNRARFTIGHEIGHFCLKHAQYLRSETVLERDLLMGKELQDPFNYERLELQANMFAADLLLPDEAFVYAMAMFRSDLQIKYRGHGYIFVDDQPDNLLTYQKFLTMLSIHFEVSKQVIEIKLKKMNWLNDQRLTSHSSSSSPLSTFSLGGLPNGFK